MQPRTAYTRADQLTIVVDGPARSTCTCKWKMWIEILVTSVIIAVIWGLLSLPSVFYFLPQSDEYVPPQVNVFWPSYIHVYVKHRTKCIYNACMLADDEQKDI